MTLAPRPGVKTTVKDVSIATKLEGRAWIDEEDYEVVRLDLETIDNISIGLGLIARLHKGATFSLERQKAGDGTWLPLRATLHPKGRIALLKRVDIEVVTRFGDFRKFTVDTAVSFTLPNDGKK